MLNVKRLHRVWTERGKEREKERGEGAIQSRILDFSLQWFRLCLTLAAAQSNMPLCWRERAMETWFLLFFSWLNPWLVVNTKRSCCLNIICYENASSTRRGNHRWISTPFLHVWSAFKPRSCFTPCSCIHVWEKKKKMQSKGPAFDCVCVQFDQ